YEGTGRGFVLRFLHWLESQSRPLRRHDLQQPIRWAAEDPVERLIFDLLALDAAPHPEPPLDGALVAEALDRDALASDEGLLRQAFGLLVHAHYRTTPGDLQRILDAPNLRLHVLRRGGWVVAVTLVAREGGLSPTLCEQLAAGRRRLRGHALPDTLISHAGMTGAGTLQMIRSVRIATHPACRRQGLAGRLVDHVHSHYQPDLFGTMFGATESLLQFRRALGYELVRLGVSRGSRTGEPSVVMLRPCTPQAAELIATLQVQLAGDLPVLLGEERELSEGLGAALSAGLPEAVPLSTDEILAAVRRYAHGPCPSDVVIRPLRALATEHREQLTAIPGGGLLCQRVLDGVPWRVLAASSGQSIPAAQRQARRATQVLLGQLGSR
ncbi:MAG: tRNA(Met) cytidine acetyltransferase, partial [Myxococcota bacterium]